jgi:hypothetical protein
LALLPLKFVRFRLMFGVHTWNTPFAWKIAWRREGCKECELGWAGGERQGDDYPIFRAAPTSLRALSRVGLQHDLHASFSHPGHQMFSPLPVVPERRLFSSAASVTTTIISFFLGRARCTLAGSKRTSRIKLPFLATGHAIASHGRFSSPSMGRATVYICACGWQTRQRVESDSLQQRR